MLTRDARLEWPGRMSPGMPPGVAEGVRGAVPPPSFGALFDGPLRGFWTSSGGGAGQNDAVEGEEMMMGTAERGWVKRRRWKPSRVDE